MTDQERDDRRLHALSRTMQAFAEATTDYGRLLETVAASLCELVGDGAFVAVMSEDETELRPAGVRFRDADAEARARSFLSREPIRVDGTSLGARVVRTRAGVLLREVDLEALAKDVAPDHEDLIRSLDIRSFLVLPLQIRERVLGFASLARLGAAARPFTDNDEAIARNLAEHAALAMANAQLLESLQRELDKRLRAEDEAARYVSLIEHSGEFIAMAGLDGKILFINRGGRQLLGLAPDQDLSALRLAEFHTDDGLKRGPIIQAKGRWQGRGQLRHSKTGELIDMQVSSFLVRDADGKPTGFATVQQDVRETKRLEAQLRQAQKMEAIGTLAGGIAHDFNNILGAILGNLELARLEIGPGHRAQPALEEIGNAGRRAVALVRQILTFGRQGESTKRIVRLGPVVEEVAALLRSTISARIEIVAEVAADAPNVSADPTQIHQILVNLGTNAWHALEGRRGRIQIELGGLAADDAAAPVLEGVSPARWARLRVTDDGHGMDAATLERIFDPFFTTKAPGEGTGLGLSVVHGIVREHRGTIRVDSAPGRGTTFEILLPGVEAEVDVVVEPPPARLDGRGRRLLLIDDERSLMLSTEFLLRNAGYEVRGFTRADEAFEGLRRDPEAFDLVLTDYNMPGLSGLDVAKVVAAIRPGLPVILASGHVSERLRHDAARAGIKQVVFKPYSLEDICAAIDRHAEPRRAG
ncbi:MAG TPA: ATP-binding protein [Polyangia bacterium]|nr:ATP-binding protein [Polyangia bacterium]